VGLNVELHFPRFHLADVEHPGDHLRQPGGAAERSGHVLLALLAECANVHLQYLKCRDHTGKRPPQVVYDHVRQGVPECFQLLELFVLSAELVLRLA
jgi:hypothetical protein